MLEDSREGRHGRGHRGHPAVDAEIVEFKTPRSVTSASSLLQLVHFRVSARAAPFCPCWPRDGRTDIILDITAPGRKPDATAGNPLTMSIHVLLINGPNLNLLGTREPQTYGHDTLGDVESRATAAAEAAGGTLVAFQSNYEGALVERIHAARTEGVDGIVINAGE